MSERGLIIIVHGSRDPKWRGVFSDFMGDIRSAMPDQIILLAFMEIASPTLLEATQEMVDKGISTIDILPFFMADGGHVDHDIPVQVKEVKTQYPQIEIVQLAPIGKHPLVKKAMLQVIEEALKADSI